MLQSFPFQKLARFGITKEWLDKPHQISEKVRYLSNLIKKSKHSIIFTGAGISTSIGIPDYRSEVETVVSTGPGIWNRTLETGKYNIKIDQIVDEAIPSLTHMAIKTLISKQIFKYVISQNTDGLHLKSGVHFSQIAELHGNRNVEKCTNCQQVYYREYRTYNKQLRHNSIRNHETGRKCQNCGGVLVDSIVYFGQKLPKGQLVKALSQTTICDLLLCVGSSLTVKPSINIPIIAQKRNIPLCIINIQQTAFDKFAQIKINGFCDIVMSQLMQQLSLPIEPYIIQYILHVTIDKQMIRIQGKDKKFNNCYFIQRVRYGGREYGVEGYFVEFQVNCQEGEIQIYFYGRMDRFVFHLPKGCDLSRRQAINFKIVKNSINQQWKIQQI